jgi:beta-mannosidase
MNKIYLLVLLLFCSCADKYISLVKTPPFEVQWQFSEQGINTWHNATVPGDVQTDLLNNKLIEEPLFDNNEMRLQWIAEKNWTYRTEFNVNDSVLKFKAVDFIFEGIDTYADVFINDSLLFTADNMFVEWRVDGKKYLHSGMNSLRVQLYAPVALAGKFAKGLKYQLPTSDEVVPNVAPFIRKAPYHFGWDWSPRFLTMGIWKPVRMVANDKVYIKNIQIRTIEIADTCAWLSAEVSIQSDYDLPNATLTLLDAFKQFKIHKGVTTAAVKFKIFHPELWWPNGYGNQKLYELTSKLYVNAYLVDSISTRTGIRTIELLQEDDNDGRGFYFKVNGLPVFMKGANYVPQSNFPSSVSNADYIRLINDAASVGMNMLRVWGGGIYEQDIFYNLCDEKGILVWQDFMFAGSMYPGDSTFNKSVKKEVIYQIERLRNHPSIALWCGNNEVEVAWKNWGWQKKFNINSSDSIAIYENYKNLFEKFIPKIIEQQDAGRSYISSSPESNWGKKVNFNYGNMHYWGVWHGEEAIDSFRVNVPRFMTEYGMQSYPSFQSLKKNSKDERITLSSDFIKNRQRSYKGNGLLVKYVEDYFGKPGNVEDLCYLSQLNQREAMRISIESHRKDARFCMGSLYWQMNDVWDGASWSTIEHSGKWKAAHYELKRLYAQNILIAETLNDTSRMYFQSENTNGQKGKLMIRVLDMKGRAIVNYSRSISAGYLVAENVFELPLKSLKGGFNKEEFFINAFIEEDEKIIAFNNHFFVKPANLHLLKPDITYTVTPNDSGATILISSNVVTLGVMLEFENENGFFSDNYFDLLPGVEKKIIYTGKISEKLSVVTLNARKNG